MVKFKIGDIVLHRRQGVGTVVHVADGRGVLVQFPLYVGNPGSYYKGFVKNLPEGFSYWLADEYLLDLIKPVPTFKGNV